MSEQRSMFGPYRTEEFSGVNPPYAPTYPVEWGYLSMRMVEVITRVDPKKIEAMFADGRPATPFEIVNDRMAIRFMVSYGHTMSYYRERMFALKAIIPVRYEGYFAHTNLYAYNSDTLGVMSGREVYGSPEKDCRYGFTEKDDGTVSGWVNRRGNALADFSFTPDPTAPAVPLTDGEQPVGELHVRRVPDFSVPTTAYADVVYRNEPINVVSSVPGKVVMNLYGTKFDSLAELEPEILSARFAVAGPYEGSVKGESRKLVRQLLS